MIRRRLSTRRVGHAGTLDPLATGLLVIAVGPATRFLQYLPLEPKVYEAEITFGQSSDTYDAEGELSAFVPPPADLRAAVEAALPKFHGLIQQYPPAYSAVKIKGKPLYKYAREGQAISVEPRTIHVASIDILSCSNAQVRVRIECSGGTYIRTIAHDLGAELGCGAYLTALTRTRVGRFTLEQAMALDEIAATDLMPLDQALPPMPLVPIEEKRVGAIREGRPIPQPGLAEGSLVALLDPAGRVFSAARVVGDFLQPECVIPAEVFDGTL